MEEEEDEEDSMDIAIPPRRPLSCSVFPLLLSAARWQPTRASTPLRVSVLLLIHAPRLRRSCESQGAGLREEEEGRGRGRRPRRRGRRRPLSSSRRAQCSRASLARSAGPAGT